MTAEPAIRTMLVNHREDAVQISVSDAKAQLAGPVRSAETGDEVILTRRGEPAVRLVLVERAARSDERWALFETLDRSAKASFGPTAARRRLSLR